MVIVIRFQGRGQNMTSFAIPQLISLCKRRRGIDWDGERNVQKKQGRQGRPLGEDRCYARWPAGSRSLRATHAGCGPGPDGHLSFAVGSSSMPAFLLAKDSRNLKQTREEDMHVMVLIFVRSFCISTAMVDKVINWSNKLGKMACYSWVDKI